MKKIIALLIAISILPAAVHITVFADNSSQVQYSSSEEVMLQSYTESVDWDSMLEDLYEEYLQNDLTEKAPGTPVHSYGLSAFAERDEFDEDCLSYIRAQNEKDNYVFSPLSFRVALILAAEGADNATRSQLLSAMGFSSEEEMKQWYAEVRKSVDIFDEMIQRGAYLYNFNLEAMYSPTKAQEMSVHAYRVLNSIWNNSDTYGEFLPDYIRTVSENYGATAESVPANRITYAVNHWCDEATDGLIPKISDDLSECAAVLVNAVYLKSSWIDEFSKYSTEAEEFTDINGNVTSRDMMKAMDRYPYYEDEDTKLISIPLNGGLTFIAVLGDASNWLADYCAAKYADVDLWIPKLDTESSFGKDILIQYLQDRGAVDAFNKETADFSRMADYPWYIGDILQRAKIKTDEEGLEAAAATVVEAILAAGMGPLRVPQYREFHANKPFQYFIVTTGSQTPLVVFAGQEVK